MVFACSGKSDELDLIESFVVSVRGSSAFSSLEGEDHKSEDSFKSYGIFFKEALSICRLEGTNCLKTFKRPFLMLSIDF